MDELAVNKAFFVGFDRTEDLLAFVPDGDEGEAELVGVFVAVVNELAERWGTDERGAVARVTAVFA